MSLKGYRRGISLVEVLVAIAIIGLLMGLAIPAIQRARESASRVDCAARLRQIGVATHLHIGEHGAFPVGMTSRRHPSQLFSLGWHARLLPYVGEEPLWQATLAAYREEPRITVSPVHIGQRTIVKVFGCPSDARVSVLHKWRDHDISITSYLGVNGTSGRVGDGVLFRDSQVRPVDITDGLSTTLQAGERPPSWEYSFGWWYAAAGYDGHGTLDMLLGVTEINRSGQRFAQCPRGPYQFQAGSPDDYCDLFHFWSLHPGGAHFLICDGSVQFLRYSAANVLPALATRAGGESANIP